MKNRFTFNSSAINQLLDRLQLPVSDDKDDKYRSIIQDTTHGYFLTTADGAILETNKAASELFGYSEEEFKTLNRQHIMDHADPLLLSALKKRERDGFSIIETTGIKKDGTRFQIEFSSTTFIDKKGDCKCSTIVTDISKRKQAEAALQLSLERYNLVVKATKQLVWDWDLCNGMIYRHGYFATDHYNKGSIEFITSIEDLSARVHPNDRANFEKQIGYYISTKKETDFNVEYRVIKPDGGIAYISDRGHILRSKSGVAVRLIGAAEDITERKQTAIAIEESEQRYKLFIQQSTEGIWRVELKKPVTVDLPIDQMIEACFTYGYLAECNDSFAKMYGYDSAEKIIGIPLKTMLPESNPLNLEYLRKFLSSGFKVQEELSYEIDKEGNQLVFINNMIGIVENNHLIRAWGTQRDITKQKKAESALVDSENHLKAIINADPECIKLLNSDGIILEMNPSGLRMLGAADASQVLGKKALNLVAPQYHQNFQHLLKRIFEGESGKLEFEIINFNKERLFMQSSCVPLKNAGGEIVAALAVTRDITETKLAQSRLLASQERYQYLFNNNPASIIIWDIDTLEIIEANETTMDMYGYTVDEFKKLQILDLYPEDKKGDFLDSVGYIRKRQTQKVRYVWHHVDRAGETLVMEITSHKIQYKNRNAVLAVGTNITEKTMLEKIISEEREMKQQQITAAVITGQEKERTELGEELHDNINQVLASTKLYIECALKDDIPRRDLLNESRLLVEKAMAEIRKLSKSLLPPSLGEVGLLQALDELVESIMQVNKLNIVVEWQLKDEKKLNNNIKLTIFRIVQEQLNNVLKHAEAGNTTICIRQNFDQLELRIRDDGRGFDTSLKREGVGLRNINSRAKVNKGNVTVFSVPGKGCELIVSFPLPD